MKGLLPNSINTMRQCALCHKGSRMVGKRRLLRGHYNPVNWTRKHPNLQRVKLPTGRRALICTQCLRMLNKTARKFKLPVTVPVKQAVA